LSIKTGIDINRPNLKYAIECPDGKKFLPPTIWRWSEETFLKAKEEGKIDFIKKKDGDWQIFTKMYIYDEDGEEYQIKPRSLLLDVGLTKDGGKELKDIFHDKVFDYPKPTTLIEYLLSIILKNNGVVLDFFAGTGTTAHTVLKFNQDESRNYQFILCTNDEEKICSDICYPRIEKIMKGYKNLKGEQVKGLGGNLKYFKTDFVDSAPTDKNKIDIVKKSTEMLCIKENAFELVSEGDNFKIFKNSNHHLGIIFDDDVSDFVDEAKKIKSKINVYAFSLDESVPEKEFRAIKDRVKLCPIPEVILHVYRRVFKND